MPDTTEIPATRTSGTYDAQSTAETGVELHYLSRSYLPSTTAASIHVAHMCQAFGEVGQPVTLYSWLGDGRRRLADDLGQSPSFRVRHIGWHRCHRLRWPIQRLAGVALAWRFRHVERAVFYGRNLYALTAIARRGLPVIFEMHKPPASQRARAAFQQLIHAPGFRALVVISQALADAVQTDYPELLTNSVHVIHDAAPEAPAVKAAYELIAQRPRVIYAGSLHPGKGADTAIRLAARLPECDFHIYGGNEDQIASLATQAPDNVRFHGHVDHATIMARLADHDIALAPYGTSVKGEASYRHNGQSTDLAAWMSPLKLFEYMSAALPIITTDLPVLNEILTPGTTAEMTRPDDDEALYTALRSFIDDPARRARLGKAARSQFEQGHSWSARARRLLPIIKGAAQMPADPSASSERRSKE
jgi:glycosyltransferase involved in cell wall biosynthesis